MMKNLLKFMKTIIKNKKNELLSEFHNLDNYKKKKEKLSNEVFFCYFQLQ